MKFIFLFTLVFQIFTCSFAGANIFNDIKGILTDPLKLDSSTENILHSIERTGVLAQRLEGKMNEDLTDRINQIDDVIQRTRVGLRDDIKAVTSVAFDRVSDLQTQFFSKASELLECSVVVGLFDIQTTLAQTLNNLGERKPSITLFGWTVWSVEIQPNDIVDPIASFRKIKELSDQKISEITDKQHPTVLTDSYAEITRLVKKTRCHYPTGSGLWIDLFNYELEYIRLQKYWIGQVTQL